MTIDYNSLVYDPIYSVRGVAGELSTADGTTASVTVLDRTKGEAVGNNPLVETLKPAALVRARELAANEIEIADVTDGEITFNGKTWRIKSVRARPSSNGEADGQYFLFLTFEGE